MGFSRILVPTWRQNGTKIKSKIDINFEGQKPTSRLDFNLFSGVRFGNKHRCKSDLKMHSKMQYILASIFERFMWVLDSKLGAFCLQDAPRYPNLAPKMAQEPPKTDQEPPKSCPRSDQELAKTCLAARGCPRAAYIPSRPRCWTILATSSEHIC